MRFLINLVLTGLVIIAAEYLLEGVIVENFFWAIITGVLIGIVNSTLGMVLRFITSPIRWLTLGLFSFVITALMVMLVDYLLGDYFIVGDFWNALYFGIIITILNYISNALFKKKKR